MREWDVCSLMEKFSRLGLVEGVTDLRVSCISGMIKDPRCRVCVSCRT